MVQVMLALVAVLVLGIITFFLYKKRKDEYFDRPDSDILSIETLLNLVKKEIAESVRDDDSLIASDINYEATMRNKKRIEKALTDCVYGIPVAVDTVKALIRDVLEKHLTDFDTVCEIYDFKNISRLEPMVKFELLLLRLQKTYGKDSIRYLESTYMLSEPKAVDEGLPGEVRYEFNASLLNGICLLELKDPVDYGEALDLLAVLIFQKYKGFGCIDTLRAQNIDGMNFGTSGSIRYEIDNKMDLPNKVVNSVWVQINAKWVHFSFLDFGSVNEMRRVVNQIVSWGVSAPMTEKRSYKVNDMYDGSRVTAIRPPTGESWACFIRKFVLSNKTMQFLLDKPQIHNWELPNKLIYFLMKSERTTAFTGQQNTGKTTMMMAAIRYIDRVNIRILEMSFELALREVYPDRNIFTVKPSATVTSSQLQDTLKKSDGYLSMVGEVAEDIVAARMIQFCLVASAFTIFSHHGKDDPGLINGLTNSLVASGEYNDHTVAISTVLDAIKSNVHLNFMNYEGSILRYIEYISEIIKEDEVQPYPEVEELLKKARKALGEEDVNGVAAAMVAYANLSREYFTRTTDRIHFSSRKIIVFNRDTMSYEPNEWYTPETYQMMLEKLNPQDRADFIKFYEENWRNKE